MVEIYDLKRDVQKNHFAHKILSALVPVPSLSRCPVLTARDLSGFGFSFPSYAVALIKVLIYAPSEQSSREGAIRPPRPFPEGAVEQLREALAEAGSEAEFQGVQWL
jgi:hypothetical protein